MSQSKHKEGRRNFQKSC